ncbi:MAG: 4Fe-4S binding protein [Deltaproteobacteria bacterium]|nr:4Fe-4S binding protein [Deltaproteobacteria bacterium]MBW2069029.1 4Fe-4S binding protein [Deltaproteobacteria bacterium]
MKRLLLIRAERCIRCRACEVACAREHGGQSRITVVETECIAWPVSCRHCKVAPCIHVCYREAIRYDERDMVIIDENLCTGCGLCELACPFGAITMVEKQKPSKCDGCQHLVLDGKTPICALTCPSGAIVYESIEAYEKQTRISFFSPVR